MVPVPMPPPPMAGQGCAGWAPPTAGGRPAAGPGFAPPAPPFGGSDGLQLQASLETVCRWVLQEGVARQVAGLWQAGRTADAVRTAFEAAGGSLIAATLDASKTLAATQLALARGFGPQAFAEHLIALLAQAAGAIRWSSGQPRSAAEQIARLSQIIEWLVQGGQPQRTGGGSSQGESQQTKQEAKAPVVKATAASEFRAVAQSIMEPLGSEVEMRSELGRQERRRQASAPSWKQEFEAYCAAEPAETVQAARAAAISNLQVDTPAKEGLHIARSHFFFASQVREDVRRVVLEGFGRVDKSKWLSRINKVVEAIVCLDFDEERLGVKDTLRELTAVLAAEPADDSSERLRSNLLTPADGRLGNPEEVNDVERMCEQLDEALLVFAPAVLGCKPAANAGKKGALGVHALFKLAKNRHMSIDNIYGVLAAAFGQVSSDAWEMRRERGAPPPDIARRMAEAVSFSLNKRMYHQDMVSEVADQLAQREAASARQQTGVSRQDLSRLESQLQAVCSPEWLWGELLRAAALPPGKLMMSEPDDAA